MILLKKVCDLHPLICELCNEEGHFNFQCWHFDDRIVRRFCDEIVTNNLYDELAIFLGCEGLSEKTSLLDMSAFGINNTLRECHLYCVVNC